MRRFDSIKEGQAATRSLVSSQNRKVGALLTFQDSSSKLCQTCFLFESVEDEKSQLIKAYPDSLGISGVHKNEMGGILAGRETAMSVILAGVDHGCLGINQHGHAEEFLIRGFDAACGQVGNIKNVVIYLSHSPCTEHDKKPSNSLMGWPKSCVKKLARLAAIKPSYDFSVVYWEAFGSIQGMQGSESEKLLGNLSGNAKNLHFIRAPGR